MWQLCRYWNEPWNRNSLVGVVNNFLILFADSFRKTFHKLFLCRAHSYIEKFHSFFNYWNYSSQTSDFQSSLESCGWEIEYIKLLFRVLAMLKWGSVVKRLQELSSHVAWRIMKCRCSPKLKPIEHNKTWNLSRHLTICNFPERSDLFQAVQLGS